MLTLPIMLALVGASPTYLACSVVQGDGPLAVTIVADESNQRATVGLPSGRIVERKALFSPTEVVIPDEETVWRVDRVNLTFQREISIAQKRIYKGKCEVRPTPKARAF